MECPYDRCLCVVKKKKKERHDITKCDICKKEIVKVVSLINELDVVASALHQHLQQPSGFYGTKGYRGMPSLPTCLPHACNLIKGIMKDLTACKNLQLGRKRVAHKNCRIDIH